MRFYLSSYKLGNEQKKLVGLMPREKKKIGYIPNALDFSSADPERREVGIRKEINELNTLGLEAELLDLRNYFGESERLKERLRELGGVFVRGGNTYILRQAMKLSGFDELIKEKINEDFLYSGYSAGVCILAKDLRPLKIVDDPTDFPYEEIKEPIWEGLGFLDYMILPHYDSDHPESKRIDEEIKFYKENNIPFKPLRDGEVIIID